MKKVFEIEDLDCAHCAAKIEDGIRGIEGVEDVRVNFLAQKLTLTAADDKFEQVLKEAVKLTKKIEPDCTIVL